MVVRIRKTIRYYMNRFRLRHNNCTKCRFFDNQNGLCMGCGYHFLRYIALVTTCEHFKEKEQNGKSPWDE